MATATNSLAHHTPSRTEALVQTFLDPRSQIGPLGKPAGVLLEREDLVRVIGEIEPKGQERFVDKVDQVRLPDGRFFPPAVPSSYTHIGVHGYRPT